MNIYIQITLTGQDLASLIALALGLIVSFTQLVYYKGKRAAQYWLALANLCSVLVFAELFLFRTGLITSVPHLYRVGYIFSLLYMPLSYFYVRSVLLDRFPGRSDLIHLLPACIFVLDHLSFFATGSDAKYSMLTSSGLNAVLDFTQGSLLHREFYVFLITFVYLVYCLAEVILLALYMRANKEFFETGNGPWSKWLFFYITIQILIVISSLSILLSGNSGYLIETSTVFAIIASIFITCSLFVHPENSVSQSMEPMLFVEKSERLNLSQLAPSRVNGKPGNSLFAVPSTQHIKSLTIEQIETIRIEIESILRDHEPYLKHGYSLQDLSNGISRPLYQVSNVINKVYGMNFNDLINKYRVHYAIKMSRSKEAENLNIHGLGDRCGFSNRNTFTAAFKKVTGKTPSIYFKTQ